MCLVGVKTGRMENRERKIGWKMLFSTVWLGKENRKNRKPRRKFSLPGPLFLSSQIWRKMRREKCCESTFTQIPSLTYPSFMTWWLLPTNHHYHFCLFSSLPSQHTNVQVLLSLSLSLSQRGLIKLIHSIVSYSHYIPH